MSTVAFDVAAVRARFSALQRPTAFFDGPGGTQTPDSVIEAVADCGSVLELRRDWGVGVVTALARFEGRPFGLIANDCHHLGGAIDAPAADKLGAFLRLCQAHGLPIVSLCDTPGFMVGPEAEKEATVTRFSRLFIDAAALTVPFGTVIVRKGYGLGAQAMAAGTLISTSAPA